MSNLLLSVCLITYNHKHYIAQAIESVLIQRVNFNYEFIIADDCSTDGTTDILKQYQKKYPEKIRLILQQKNEGAAKNWMDLITAPIGKYIAYFEGDDYWTDPTKLQRQVDFLEANPDYAICYHAVNVLNNGIEKSSALNRSDKEETYSILDLANSNIMHTPSVIFRNGLFEKFPDWFEKSPVGDYILHLLNAKKGLIKYFPEIMAVYRVHEQGVWSQKPATEIYPKWLWLLDKLMKEDFKPAAIETFNKQKTRMLNEYIEWLLYYNKFEQIKDILHEHCNNNDKATINFLTEIFLKRIVDSENYLKILQTSRSYKFARKLSILKAASISALKLKI